MKIHIVQKGDTLWEISKSYGVDFEEVKELNSQLSSPDMIMPGMKVKIPGSSKAVKKEEMSPKETSKAEHSYKDISPKPMPVIKEDDKEKPKEMKAQMPIEPLPKIPIQEEKEKPEQPMPQMPIQKEKQKPMLEQEFNNYTTVNFPKIPYYPETKEKMPEKEKEQIKPQPLPEPQKQPMPMLPMCCHIVHPCYPPVPFPAMGAMPEGFAAPQPMIHPDFHPQMAGDMMQPKKDCGCGGNAPFMPQPMPQYGTEYQQQQPMPQFGIEYQQQPMPQFGSEYQQQPDPQLGKEYHQHSKPQLGAEYKHEPEFKAQYQMPPSNMYPPQFGNTGSMNNHPYPGPPAYPDFSASHNREEKDEETNE